jgi:hypothetical protein
LDRVRAVAGRYGFGGEIEIHELVPRRSGLSTSLFVQVVLAATFTAFFASFGTEAGKEAYAAFSGWVKELWAARGSTASEDGCVDIWDAEGTRVIVVPTVPDLAIEALATLDWAQLHGTHLFWDAEEEAWIGSVPLEW